MSRKGRVYWDDRLAGAVEEQDDGHCVFTYDPIYREAPDAQPVSLTLPLSEDPVSTLGLHPFFDGLVPEGWLLDLAVRNWKLDPADRMGLLLSVCSDCIGAVRVISEDPVA